MNGAFRFIKRSINLQFMNYSWLLRRYLLMIEKTDEIPLANVTPLPFNNLNMDFFQRN